MDSADGDVGSVFKTVLWPADSGIRCAEAAVAMIVLG
jgi:hypothetical protein